MYLCFLRQTPVRLECIKLPFKALTLALAEVQHYTFFQLSAYLIFCKADHTRYNFLYN